MPLTSQVCVERDQSPAVVMCVVGCYDILLKDVDCDYIAKDVIPVLTPLLYLRTLNRYVGQHRIP